jgi:hypothetical protein
MAKTLKLRRLQNPRDEQTNNDKGEQPKKKRSRLTTESLSDDSDGNKSLVHMGGKLLSIARNIQAANTKAAKSRRSNGEEDSEDSSSGSSSDSSSILSLASNIRNNIEASKNPAAASTRDDEEDSEDSSSGSSSDSSSTDDSDGSSMTRRDINVAKKKKKPATITTMTTTTTTTRRTTRTAKTRMTTTTTITLDLRFNIHVTRTTMRIKIATSKRIVWRERRLMKSLSKLS